MSKTRDIWYVRFPDGQVVRAKSTRAVRRHLEMGRIPFDCRVRRSGQYDWTTLDWAPEFADLLKQPAKSDKSASKPAPIENGEAEAPGDFELHAVGMRGIVEELITALDSTLSRGKLTIAALAGLLTACLLVGVRFFPFQLEGTAELGLSVAVGVAVVAVFALCTSVIGQISVIELSQLREPTRREVTTPLIRNWVNLFVGWILVGGLLTGAMVGARALPDWLSGQANLPEAVVQVGIALGLVVEAALWPALALLLLLGPIIVVEDCSVLRGLQQWLALIRQNWIRVFLYEGLIATIGVLIAIPFLAPVWLAGWHNASASGAVGQATLLTLSGLAATPFIAYLIIANVFIYLNLRYEFSASAK